MGAVVWIVTVQVFLLALNPFCHLQRPGLSRVTVRSVDRNPDSQITDFVSVKVGEETQVLSLSKAEAAELHADDEAWILEAWYQDSLRPTHFRLSLQRVLLEYPMLLLLPVALLLWWVKKARLEAEAAPLPPVRRTFTDDFHLRAQRFGKQEAPLTTEVPGKSDDEELKTDQR